ncbi:hypothetical protein [Kitasatospora sp. NBC_00315]|uniref:hypothetical protein n=1 Tax=Kitasatospora sp. NBC_00315 TaxID=2975963 RepID=UPI003251ECE4
MARHDTAQSYQITDSALSQIPAGRDLTIATLGPAGTSSEEASRFFRGHLRARGHDTRLRLHDRYEEAAATLAEGEADLLLVANAYADIAAFYMNPDLRLAAVFIKDTPHYGLVAAPGVEVPRLVRVATHPAPKPIVAQLLPAEYELDSLVLVNSTSAAAAAVRAGEVDLALTTAPAARLNGLEFISRTRPIRMVWSAFTRADLVGEQRLGQQRIGQQRSDEQQAGPVPVGAVLRSTA